MSTSCRLFLLISLLSIGCHSAPTDKTSSDGIDASHGGSSAQDIRHPLKDGQLLLHTWRNLMQRMALATALAYPGRSATIQDHLNEIDQAARKRRDSPPPPVPAAASIEGGYSSVAVNDEDVQTMAAFAVTSLSQSMNGNFSLGKIISAQRQVVAGSNYKLTIELVDDKQNRTSCEVVIFDQPWTATRKVTRSACKPVATASKP